MKLNRLVVIFILMLASATMSALASTKPTGFGPLKHDPEGLVDLPEGFHYAVVARAGDRMSDSLVVPPLADGMGAFPGPDGTTIVVCNHETFLPGHGPYGQSREFMSYVPTDKIFDLGMGVTPCPGGTTTFVWDTQSGKLVRQFASLVGTLRNCSGTVTPWGTWLTCEENTYRAGVRHEEQMSLQQDHGWLFEVPATAEPALAAPEPLKAMGRFYHEGAAVDLNSGVIYMTEDLHDGLVYRFVPENHGDLRSGRLQALALMNQRTDTRNGETSGPPMRVGEKMQVHWIDLDGIDAPNDDLRIRGYALGAALFSRGEGMIERDGSIYFTCTSGGAKENGQIWCYAPSLYEGTAREGESPATLELYLEPNDADLMDYPDNITVTPWGDLLVCEDPHATARLVTVAPDHSTHIFARARVPSEFAGATFSPDGSTLFVNLEVASVTIAITGPWPAR